MRIVVLTSSIYSETACAITAAIAESGYAPAGVLSLRTFDYGTVLRKLGQWGTGNVMRYARTKLLARKSNGATSLHNPYLAPYLIQGGKPLRNLREVSALYGFPVATCKNQNSKQAITQLRKWSPDLVVFAGGNLLRRELLQTPRLGVINVHLGLLPEIRGMSTVEWSLLKAVPAGITIHYMDSGIDTGPILARCEFAGTEECGSLEDLRKRLIAFGVRQLLEVLRNLEHGSISPEPQSQLDQDNQFFVTHERLKSLASDRLALARAGSRTEVA